MCVHLGQHELIKSIQEDLGPDHRLPTNVDGCLLLKLDPPVRQFCTLFYFRCSNDRCPCIPIHTRDHPSLLGEPFLQLLDLGYFSSKSNGDPSEEFCYQTQVTFGGQSGPFELRHSLYTDHDFCFTGEELAARCAEARMKRWPPAFFNAAKALFNLSRPNECFQSKNAPRGCTNNLVTCAQCFHLFWDTPKEGALEKRKIL